MQKNNKRTPHPTQRFTTVHKGMIGPPELPESNTFGQRPRYLITMIDNYSRYLEAAPLSDISAATVAKAFLSCWIDSVLPDPCHRQRFSVSK